MNILIGNLKPAASNCSDQTLGEKYSTLHFPLGLGIIASVLKNSGREFDTYDSYVNGSTDGFLKTIENKKPDIVLLSGFLGNYTYPFLKDISLSIKSINQLIKIIVGGPIANTIPDLLVSMMPIDFVVKGEGERTIPELLDAIERKSDISLVKGIYSMDSLRNMAFFTGERERIQDLDMSWPLYKAFPMEPYVNYLKETERCWELSTSRGCYNRCNFCKLSFGQKITTSSLQSVVEHMKFVSDNYMVNKFSFVDDNFLNNTERVSRFRELLLQEPYKFKWRFQGRADRISIEVVEKLKEVGLYNISFGLESGSQEMLNRYRKNLDIKKALANLNDIKSMVRIHTTFIVGGPCESWDTIEETKRFIRMLKLNNSGIGILTLFPGTFFYDKAKRNGLITDDEEYCMNLGPVYDKPYVNISDMSDDDLINARDMLVETAAEFGAYT